MQPLKQKLLLSRLLTRSGDQAWDFALPLALIIVFPDHLQLGIGLFFLSKLFFTLLAPIIGGKIDQWSRKTTVIFGIGLQTIAVLAGSSLIWWFFLYGSKTPTGEWHFIIWYLLVTCSFVLGSAGSMIMDIYVTQELIPTMYKEYKGSLTAINARMRQIDLATEVGSPLLTGVIMAALSHVHPLAGFSAIVLWNAVSFIPEYFLVTQCNQSLSDSDKATVKAVVVPQSIFKRYVDGYKTFKSHRLAIPLLAYSMLWFSVLSPHGVLLTTFLKGSWQLPESELGIFRALGAVFGVSSTLIFPVLAARFRLIPASAMFITVQALAVIIALLAFTNFANHWFFLAAILLSRIGLYGFMQGETELKQILCLPGERGRINGFASAINHSATLLLLLAGTFFTNPEDFIVLTAGSVFFVCLGAVMFIFWAYRQRDSLSQVESSR